MIVLLLQNQVYIIAIKLGNAFRLALDAAHLSTAHRCPYTETVVHRILAVRQHFVCAHSLTSNTLIMI